MAQLKFQTDFQRVRFVCKNDEYLLKHKDFIQQTTTKLNDYFNPLLTVYVLKTAYDPETKTTINVLEIQTSEKYDIASESFENFENDWWLDKTTDLVIDVKTL